MELTVALRLPEAPCLALVGAGGKTTALFTLARQFPRALMTTTTHLAERQVKQADHHFLEEDCPLWEGDLPWGVIAVTGAPAADGRVAAVGAATLQALHALSESHRIPLLIEADGARMCPLKAPADHEPAIPPFVDTVVVVHGLSALGKPLTPAWVHRPERFAALAGLPAEATISPQAILRVATHPEGGLKQIPPAARRVALLNQADTLALQAAANGLAPHLLTHYHAVVVASLASAGAVFAVHEPVAGIVLAAGAARRFGQPKQLLEWEGETLVHRAARVALEAGLSPVVVVVGAYADQVAEPLRNLPVRLVENADWRAGQSASLRAGLMALPFGVGAAVFLLADQPRVPPSLIRSLVERHASSLAPIVAPLIGGERGNPVLFDRVTFDELCALSGDVGGRQLFSRYPVTWLPWHDASISLDVDTADDWEALS